MTSPANDQRSARLRALLSLALLAVLAVYVGVLVAANLGPALLALCSIVFVACGGWWFVAKRRAASTAGLVAVLAGAGGLVAAVVLLNGGVLRLLWNSVVVALLLGAAVWAARSAVRVASREPDATERPRVVPRGAVLICNPRSGGGKVDQFGLVDRARSMGVRTMLLEPGVDLATLARTAIAEGADCVGMAGGDGSQALVAAIASASGVPFVCVPAGTRNHFALDLGLDRDDPRSALDAFRDGVTRTVDLATVNGRTFVNNVSLGVYAMVVQEEDYRAAKRQTTRRVLPDALNDPSETFHLRFESPDGTVVDDAVLILVSNNPYVLRASPDAATRRRIDAGTLGICAVSASSGPQAAEVLLSALTDRRSPGERVRQFEAPRFDVSSTADAVPAGVDGEAVSIAPPLEFRSVPAALTLLVPEANVEAAARRAARQWTLSDLRQIVTGARHAASR